MQQEKIYSARLLDAVCFAAKAHRTQRRKAPPHPAYIEHPLGVAHYLQEAGVTDEDILIAAILHDVVEDTDRTLEEIREQFGRKVANIVEGCSDDKSLPKAMRKKLQVAKVKNGSKGVQLVKMADKLYNCKDAVDNRPPDWSEDRVTGYLVWSKKVVSQCRGLNKILDRWLDEVFDKHILADLDEKQFLQDYYEHMGKGCDYTFKVPFQKKKSRGSNKPT